MIIANPIYDVVFKRLMQNDRAAKFFIGTLLDEPIEHVELLPQEFVYSDTLAGLAVFRLDFVATVRTSSGEHKKILIEIQKARNLIDLMRFRNYLAEQYKKEDQVAGRKQVLPITTIYILGFQLPEISSPCLKVARVYEDLITKKRLTTKSDFVEKLTHDSYVIQVERISARYQTSLDKLLSLFEQQHFIAPDSNTLKEFPHAPDSDDLQVMLDILQHSGANPESRKAIETEKEAWRSVEDMFAEKEAALLRKLDLQDKAMAEKDKTLTEKEQALSEKDKTITEQDKALTEKEQALSEKDKALTEKERELSEKDRQIAELLRKLEGKP